MRGPGIEAGQKRRDPFTSVDFAPTFADAGATTPGSAVDGMSLLGVARAGDQGWTRAVLTETGPKLGTVRDTDEAGNPLQPGATPDVRYLIGIRTDRYLYVNAATGEEELYDLVVDPEQYRNLVGDARYAEALRTLREDLKLMRSCDAAECRQSLPGPGGP
jgi:arylsulfatase A-like enzyme